MAVLSGFPVTELSKLQPGIKPDSPKPESCALTIRNPLLTSKVEKKGSKAVIFTDDCVTVQKGCVALLIFFFTTFRQQVCKHI